MLCSRSAFAVSAFTSTANSGVHGIYLQFQGIQPTSLTNLHSAPFQIGPIFKNIALKTVYRTTVEAGSAGETFVRGVRRRQVFSDFRFYTRFHSHTVGYGCSGVGKRGYSQKKTEEKCHDFHGLYDSQHNCSPTRYCQTACYFGGCELYKNITFGGLPCIQAT